MTSSVFLIILLFVLLGTSVWVGISLGIVAWAGVTLFSNTKPGILLFTSYWNTYESITLASLPMFIWMGEILLRTRLAEQMFSGLAPWLDRLPGRLLHVNVFGCGLFGAVSGSSAATCATIAKISLPELGKRGYDSSMILGTLCGAGTFGILIPPSIPMIIYAVASDVSIIRMFIAGIVPGIILLSMFSGYLMIWALANPKKIPIPDRKMSLIEKLRNSRELFPILLLIAFVFFSMATGMATANEASAVGVLGSLLIAWWGGTLTRQSFVASVSGALRLSCMIMFILGAASFLTVAMGFTGIPRTLAEWVTSLNLSPFLLISVLTVVYLIMGCLLDGVSMIVLTTAVVLPMVKAAGFDPIWFGVYIIIMIELAQITPPVGFNLFVLQGMSGWDIWRIAKASLPFFTIMLIMTVILVIFPDIVTWLPTRVMGS